MFVKNEWTLPMSISVTARLVTLARAEGMEEGMKMGAALVLAELVRTYDRPTIAKEMMKVVGLTVRKAKAVGVEEFDLRELRKAARA